MRFRAPLLVEAGVFACVLLFVLVSGPSGPTPGAGRATAVLAPTPASVEHGDGLSDSHDGYLMAPVSLPARRGPGMPIAFRIEGPDGSPVSTYRTVHTKPLHAYVVRDDLSAYQHLHPRLEGGTWRAAVDIPDGGAYRLYAEFTPTSGGRAAHSMVLGVPFAIAGNAASAPLPAAAATAPAGPFTVRRLDGVAHLRAGQAKLLRFQVTGAETGQPASIEQFLGASAHASTFEARTLAMSHLHPVLTASADGTVTLHAQFANRGELRLYLQFQVSGVVHLAAFTLVVT